MIFRLLITPSAQKQLRKLPLGVQQRVEKKIEELCKNPHTSALDIKKLKGEEYYRLRVGDYRVIYELRNQILTIKIIAIGHRREIYH